MFLFTGYHNSHYHLAVFLGSCIWSFSAQVSQLCFKGRRLRLKETDFCCFGKGQILQGLDPQQVTQFAVVSVGTLTAPIFQGAREKTLDPPTCCGVTALALVPSTRWCTALGVSGHSYRQQLGVGDLRKAKSVSFFKCCTGCSMCQELRMLL